VCQATYIGVVVYRGIAEKLFAAASVEEVQRLLSAEVPEPFPADDDLTIWKRDGNGEWEQVSSFNFDDMEWV
jgi:hypothetical protein